MVYAVVIPILFRLAIVASSDLHLALLVQAVGVWRAMRRREIVMYFQPKVSLAQGTVNGVEALARWEHLSRGTLAPALWLPAIEQFRWLEKRFCRYTLNACCQQAWAWRNVGKKDLQLSINISPRAFTNPDLLRRVSATLETWELPPSAIEIEVTENALNFSPKSLETVEALSEMGIALALDDFGTGQSSMERLVALPFGCIKIDRTFVTDMLTDDRKRAVVKSACSLAHSMDIVVVAEGIETVDVVRALTNFGCDAGQGYLFSPPLPADEFNAWLEDNHLDTLLEIEPAEQRTIRRRLEDREEDRRSRPAHYG